MERAQSIAKGQIRRKEWTRKQADEFIQDIHAAYAVSQGVDDLTEAMKRGPFVRKVNRILRRAPAEGKKHVYADLDVDKLKDKNENSKNKHSSADRALVGLTKFHQMKLIQKLIHRE
jgi:GGDEF domain-containing protein